MLSKARSVAVWSVLVFSLLSVSILVSSPQPTAGLLVRPQAASRRQLEAPENLYASAAEALRKGNLQEARQQLDAVAVKHPDQAARAQVVAGLYAYQGGDLASAQTLLAAAASSGGVAGSGASSRIGGSTCSPAARAGAASTSWRGRPTRG